MQETPKDNCWYWRVNPKAKDLAGKSVFYAFVDLKEGKEQPDVFIVPADFVGKHLNTYPKGSPKPTSFWFDIMEEDKDKWHEAWHLIKSILLCQTDRSCLEPLEIGES